ncbi:transglutaminase domain-containing protein, partial [bacterium]|nr:transglutaminase domain-containing protein [bacterium]
MSGALRLILALLLLLVLASCGDGRQTVQAVSEPAPIVVTGDIAAGIEKYVEETTQAGGGYFRLAFDEQKLDLKLVRIHTEYLANLGPRRHFACVDLVDTRGDVYDVDFFLKGDPGAMTVTETMVHKVNGRPFYAWQQKEDKTWYRVPADGASDALLGVLRDPDTFEFIYRATIPVIRDSARMWLPFPASDSYQTVRVISIETPGQRRVLEEKEHGNEVLLLELGPGDSGRQVEIRYEVQRVEKAAYETSESDPTRYLKPERLVPMNETFRSIAEKTVEGKKGNLVQARALYDHVIDGMRYAKVGEGWGQGDAVYACDALTGNCTDFHSYFIALARSVDIPARFAIGAAIPSERDEGGVDGYHCWAEFYAEGKWWPVDISEANKYSALSTYYFGHHPANRIELSRGRDLVVEPGPA